MASLSLTALLGRASSALYGPTSTEAVMRGLHPAALALRCFCKLLRQDREFKIILAFLGYAYRRKRCDPWGRSRNLTRLTALGTLTSASTGHDGSILIGLPE